MHRAHRAGHQKLTHRSGPCSKCGGELAAHGDGGPPPPRPVRDYVYVTGADGGRSFSLFQLSH